MDTSNNINVLVEAKKEYTQQMIQILRPHLLDGMISIFNEAKKICVKKNEPKLVFITFQELLSQVYAWNQTLIHEETKSIISASKCDYIHDLITAVFVCHTKILSYVRIHQVDKKINLNIPSEETFIHEVYIELAREFWKQPTLLYEEKITNIEFQRNLMICNQIIESTIESTIRRLLPVKTILHQYLKEENEEDTSSVKTSKTDEKNVKKSHNKQKNKEDDNDEDDDDDSSVSSSSSSSSSSY